MEILDRLRAWFGGHKTPEQQYDNVEIVNAVDGTRITGPEAVKAYFERERQLADEYGSSIIFQVYQINLEADSIDEFESERLAEIKVDGSFVSGNDTVASVKKKIRQRLEKAVRSKPDSVVDPSLNFDNPDHITFFFSGRPMQEDKLFYANHFILLPCWVQIYLHDCDSDVFIAALKKLLPPEESDALDESDESDEPSKPPDHPHT